MTAEAVFFAEVGKVARDDGIAAGQANGLLVETGDRSQSRGQTRQERSMEGEWS